MSTPPEPRHRSNTSLVSTTTTTMSTTTTLYRFVSCEPHKLSFAKGAHMLVLRPHRAEDLKPSDMAWALCQDTEGRLGLVPWDFLSTPEVYTTINSSRRFSCSALTVDGGGGGAGLEGGLRGGLRGGHGGGGGLEVGGAGGGGVGDGGAGAAGGAGLVGGGDARLQGGLRGGLRGGHGGGAECGWTARRAVCRSLPWEVALRAGEAVELLERSTDAWWLVRGDAGDREIGYVKREHLQRVESRGAASPPADENLDDYMAMSANVSPPPASAPCDHTESPGHDEEEEDIYMVLTPPNSTSPPTPHQETPAQKKTLSTRLRENFATVSLNLRGKVPQLAQALSEGGFLSEEERAATVAAAAATITITGTGVTGVTGATGATGVTGVTGATGGGAAAAAVNKLILRALARGGEQECGLLLAHAGLV
ncbi:uncharacterized protein LOC144952177 [Lampetra fluviatilis]